jgi:uncharacterized cofD-like protein
MKNIVIIGGGTGTFTLLSGLRKFPSNNSVIVSSADDGGSTGVLRKELGVFPPGDIRQCLVGLSYTEKEMTDLFSYRFDQGSLSGHTVGNIILAALEKTTGSIESAINIAGKMLNIRGQVLPVTLEPTILSAVLENGETLEGEHNIDEPARANGSQIKSLILNPSLEANPKAIQALREADAIVFGPGDLFTSVLPNILVNGVKEAIGQSSAKKILVTNIMTKYGQTDGFKASGFAKVLAEYLGSKIDVAIVNNKKPKAEWLEKYKEEKAEFVEPDTSEIEKSGAKVVAADLVSSYEFQRTSGDILLRSFLRHDAEKTAKIIWDII